MICVIQLLTCRTWKHIWTFQSVRDDYVIVLYKMTVSYSLITYMITENNTNMKGSSLNQLWWFRKWPDVSNWLNVGSPHCSTDKIPKRKMEPVRDICASKWEVNVSSLQCYFISVCNAPSTRLHDVTPTITSFTDAAAEIPSSKPTT